jgi:thiamine biosynthesis lipoprotein
MLPVLLVLAGCAQEPLLHKLSGPTMGTTWNVTVSVPPTLSLSRDAMVEGIETQLEAVNASMSTYREDSEISRFNRSPVGEWFSVTPAFLQVLSAAIAVGEQSNGAYDVTVGPLVNLWGFGPGGTATTPPAAAEVASTLERVGQDKIRLDAQTSRVIKSADIYLDFSSIAKGYAVDALADWLGAQGINDYLVEVGGEMRVAGKSPRGDAWRVAIEQPDARQFGIAVAVRLDAAGIATSGDYRNFFESEGIRYSHSIDPRTGYPVEHELVSVTVVHSSTMMADAWATALVVMGAREGWSVAQRLGLAVYLIERDGEGFSSRHTEAFTPLLEALPDAQL